MSDRRHGLDELLHTFGAAPDHRAGFREDLLAGLDVADREMGRALGAARWRRPVRISPLLHARRAVVMTAFAVAVAAVIAVVVLVGVPGTSRVGGPESVSAAEVMQKALRAFSSGSTMQAEVTQRYAISMHSGGVAEYAVIGARIVMRSDGSFRITRTRARQISWETPGYAPYAPGPLLIDPDALDKAYDAADGVLRDYYRSSESPRYRFEVTTGYPLGPPDRWADFQADLSAVALAVQTDRSATVETTTLEGRPVWVVSMMGSLALRNPGETYSIAIDQQTCLPVRIQIAREGVVQLEYSWRYVRVGEPVPDTAFSFTAPEGVKTDRDDQGFRRVSLARAAANAGYGLNLPAWLPDGYSQTWCAFAEQSTLVTDVVGRNVVEVQYTRGFNTLTVTTRQVADAQEAVEFDPFEPEPYWSDLFGRDVRLTAGAFGGVAARVVVAPRTTVPHLYLVKDGILFTVAGSATAEELVAIAESMQSYGQAGSSPFATPDGPASAD